MLAQFKYNNMNKKALMGLLVAFIFPLTGYYIVKYYSDKAVNMPRRYFYDSVTVIKKNGKEITDTVWHKAVNMTFINQLGKKVDLDSLKGKILVIDFFFSRCPSICPGMAKSMKRLQNSFVNSKDSIVQFISISIDPEHDSVPQLRKFADRYTSNHDSWWFVTGDKKNIYDFALKELKANVADVNVTGKVSVLQMTSTPQAIGHFDIQPFDLKAVLKKTAFFMGLHAGCC